jgi:hypothetical protein
MPAIDPKVPIIERFRQGPLLIYSEKCTDFGISMKSDFRHLIVSLALVSLLGGCAPTGKIDASASVSDADGYYIFGVAPPGVRVVVTRGDIEDGKFHRNVWVDRSFFGYPEDGFVVGKGHSGSTLDIMSVFTTPGPIYTACGPDTKTGVFRVKAGTIVYLGQLSLTTNGDKLGLAVRNDFNSAMAFLKTHYPSLADKAVQGNFDFMQADAEC